MSIYIPPAEPKYVRLARQQFEVVPPEALPTQGEEYFGHLNAARDRLQRPLHIALVGLGSVAEYHYGPVLQHLLHEAPALEHLFRIIPVDQHKPESASAATCMNRLTAHGTHNLLGTYTVATELDSRIERGEVDGVIIATPTLVHVELMSQLARFGKPLFIEKPLCGAEQLSRLQGTLMQHPSTPVYALDWMPETRAMHWLLHTEQGREQIRTIDTIKRIEGHLFERMKVDMQRIGLAEEGMLMDLGVHPVVCALTLLESLGFATRNAKLESSLCASVLDPAAEKAFRDRRGAFPGETYGHLAVAVDDVRIDIGVGKHLRDDAIDLLIEGTQGWLQVNFGIRPGSVEYVASQRDNAAKQIFCFPSSYRGPGATYRELIKCVLGATASSVLTSHIRRDWSLTPATIRLYAATKAIELLASAKATAAPRQTYPDGGTPPLYNLNPLPDLCLSELPPSFRKAA